MKKVLFITYDGLTDPLGQSQILPYLCGLSSFGYQISILSFEKEDFLRKNYSDVSKLCKQHRIIWHREKFNSGIPILSKLYDQYKMKFKAKQLHHKFNYDLLHCRSYISAECGLKLKKKTGVKFLFDMRGFWPDEKKDGGHWDMKNPIYRYIYRKYKRLEAEYIKNADAIVSLTQKGREEVMTWQSYRQQDIVVIPCSVDVNHFTLVDDAKKSNAKSRLNISNHFVLSYIGSIGTWYMLDEMLALFKRLQVLKPNSKFLILTTTDPQVIYNSVEMKGINKNDLIIKSAKRNEVPEILSASDINVSFIQPCYSKISSSPTKLGEVLAMGIPVITNSGVGDVKEIMEEIHNGVVIDRFDTETYDEALQELFSFIHEDKRESVQKTKKLLGLDSALKKYHDIYKKLLENETIKS